VGDPSPLAAWELGATAIKASIDRDGISGLVVKEALMGNSLMAGQGQAPARQAMRLVGPPDSTGSVTLSKMCGSGMRSAMVAHDMLKALTADVIVAGGMENMTNTPHLTFARKGVQYGATQLYIHMALDGVENAYEHQAMGIYAEACATEYGFSREAVDNFPIESTKRSTLANGNGAFEWEMALVGVFGKGGETLIKRDEQPFKANLDKIPTLKPAFRKDGKVTAATSASISDGAAALVRMRESTAKRVGLNPLARIVSHAIHAQAPKRFATAPSGAGRYQK
jgi:acetyl-CoA C-acetyltransferase